MLAGVALGAPSALAAEVDASVQAAAAKSFSGLSDQELTALLANELDGMDAAHRRALFTEVKMRMARHNGQGRSIRLQTQRTYGKRVIRKRDGAVVRIQTQVIRVRPTPGGSQSYGVGFEERAKAAEPEASDAPAPPVRIVNDPSP